MIAEFPVFSKITIKDKQFLDEFNSQFSPYADWAFGTLVTWWDAFDDLELSLLNNNLIIRSSYLTMGSKKFYVLLGINNIDETIEKIFDYQRQQGISPSLYSLPQYTVDAIRHSERYILIEDPNAAEYIVSSKMHASLEGHEMRMIRKKVSQFKRATHDDLVELTDMKLDTIHAKMRLINALHTWHDIYRNDSERLEGKIIDRVLLESEDIGLHCLALFVNKTLHGFALYKYLSDDTANISHIKVSFEFPNMFAYITHELASSLNKKGVSEMNFEQDLGIEGLRIYKTRLHPIKMLPKYNLYSK